MALYEKKKKRERSGVKKSKYTMDLIIPFRNRIISFKNIMVKKSYFAHKDNLPMAINLYKYFYER